MKFSVSNRSVCGFVCMRVSQCVILCACVCVYGWGLSCGKRPEQEADFHIGNFTIFYYTQKKGRKKKKKPKATKPHEIYRHLLPLSEKAAACVCACVCVRVCECVCMDGWMDGWMNGGFLKK